jgi:hypothetical protein
MGTRWLPARPFSMIPLYPWIPKRVLVTSYGRCPACHHALPRQCFVCYSCICSCDVTHTMLWRATIAHSYCAFLELCVMHWKRGEDNTHACKRGNLMTLGGVNNDLLLYT